MPWVRFEPERGIVEETEREVFLRAQKKVPKNDTPLSNEIAIFSSVNLHTDNLNQDRAGCAKADQVRKHKG